MVYELLQWEIMLQYITLFTNVALILKLLKTNLNKNNSITVIRTFLETLHELLNMRK